MGRSLIIIKLALRNLTRNGTRTIALLLLIILTIAALTFGNALFDGTDSGIRNSFIESFSGDLSVSQQTSTIFSVFGSQTPIIGSLTQMPTITAYDDVLAVVEATPGIAATTPIVCGIVVMESGSYNKPVSVFGVDAESYFKMFPGLRVSDGSVIKKDSQGIMITAPRAAAISAALGREVSVGDTIKLSYYSTGNFQLAEVPIVGILAYPIKNETLDGIVIVDADTIRTLLGLAREAITRDENAIGAMTESLDALYVGAKDVKADPLEGLKLSDIEALLLADDPSPKITSSSSAWNYLLIKFSPFTNDTMLSKLIDRNISSLDLSVNVRDWRATAGSSALYVFWLRSLFRIGIGIILAAGALIIINVLVIAVFERTKEIGMMRSLGASKSFIRALFIAETMILVFVSSIIGIVIGAILCVILEKSGIPIDNQTLASLFGTDRLRPVVTIDSAILHIIIATIIGMIAWIYPVHLALKIEPIQAVSVE